MAEVGKLHEEVAALRAQISGVATAVTELKDQLTSVSSKADKDGKSRVYGEAILEEIGAVQKKLEGFTAESLRSMINDVAALKNKIENASQGMEEFSLAELKGELLKLADMMTV